MRKVDPTPPQWEATFGRQAPMEVDLGCGRGDYAWQRAHQAPAINMVALDTKPKWIEQLQARCHDQGRKNLVPLRCDISEDLLLLFAPQTISGFTVHHPDPWWKKRHRKRRLVKPELVATLAQLLVPSGWVYLQTDVSDLGEDMKQTFAASPQFAAIDAEKLRSDHLAGLHSHREQKCQQQGIPIYRYAFVLIDNKDLTQ